MERPSKMVRDYSSMILTGRLYARRFGYLFILIPLVIFQRFQCETRITETVASRFNLHIITSNHFATAVTQHCVDISPTTIWTALVLLIGWSIQPMTLNPLIRFIEQGTTFQADILWVQRLITFQTEISHPDFPGRLPTIVTFPSSFSSVKRGRVKLGLLSGILPASTRQSPISSAVIPPGSPLVNTSKIMSLRLGRLGLTFSYASRRFLNSMLVRIIPFNPANASFCRGYGRANPTILMNTAPSSFTG